ncbi:MAG: type II toxin-antitoxin system Phd/YefM family antitoxin [Verrucomicrobiota bacterium]
MRTRKFSEAKAKFGSVLDEASAGRPQKILRRGRPQAVVIGVEQLARLLPEKHRDLLDPDPPLDEVLDRIERSTKPRR